MRITDHASGVAISRAAEVDAGNVSRWKTGKVKPSAESVVKIARTWGKPPVEALVAAGYLSSAEASEVIEVHTGLATLTDAELIAEVQQRMEGLRHELEIAKEQAASSEAPSHKKTGADSADDVKPSSAAATADAITAAAVAELEVDGVDNNREQA